MKKLVVYIVTFLGALFLGVSIVGAQYNGPNTSYSIIIDKMVGRPIYQGNSIIRYDYVDNLSNTDVLFNPDQMVYFRLRVRNTSNVRLYNVVVKDIVPGYLDPIDGPGTFDEASRIITIDAGNFEVDEEKYYYMTMQVYAQNNLPTNQSVFCIVNRAEVRNDNTYDDDTSQFCVQHDVPNVVVNYNVTTNYLTPTPTLTVTSSTLTRIPNAGDPIGLMMIIGSLVALGSGIAINKKVS